MIRQSLPTVGERQGPLQLSQGHSGQPLHYILLGRDLEQADKVPVGNVLGMAGLSTSGLKSATLSTSTTPWCPPFVPLVLSSVPILRVAVEPVLSSDLPRLEDGLQLLNQADAHVEVLVSEAGEHLLARGKWRHEVERM